MLDNLMFHSVNVYRPVISTDGVSQEISGYQLVYSSVPCFIQPASTSLEYYYNQRGLTDISSVYSNQTRLTIQNEDVLEYGTNQYHVVGRQNGLMLNAYVEWHVEQYPDGSKKRLDMESYE